MSREFYGAVNAHHIEIAATFAANNDEVKRHIECRVTDRIYAYLFEDGVHVQTQSTAIPDRWWDRWPRMDATVRRYVRRTFNLGKSRILTIDA